MALSEKMHADTRLTAFGANGEGEFVSPPFNRNTFSWAPVYTREFAPFFLLEERSST